MSVTGSVAPSSAKLGAVVSEVVGASGRAMLEALLAGERDPQVLADLAKGRLRQKLPALSRALEGRVKSHHLVLLERHLAHPGSLYNNSSQFNE